MTKSVFRFCIPLEIQRSSSGIPSRTCNFPSFIFNYQSFPRDFQLTYLTDVSKKSVQWRITLIFQRNEDGLCSLSNLPPNIQTVVENCAMTIPEIVVSAGIRASMLGKWGAKCGLEICYYHQRCYAQKQFTISRWRKKCTIMCSKLSKK